MEGVGESRSSGMSEWSMVSDTSEYSRSPIRMPGAAGGGGGGAADEEAAAAAGAAAAGGGTGCAAAEAMMAAAPLRSHARTGAARRCDAALGGTARRGGKKESARFGPALSG